MVRNIRAADSVEAMHTMDDGKATVRAVERALDLLLLFLEKGEWSMTEMAERTGLHKSTVHRMLATLEHKGFVARDPLTERYRIGMRIWELAANLSSGDDPANLLLPEMERLRDMLGETVSLYVRDGKERIRIQAVQSNQPIRRFAPIGARMPLYVGASSKVLLAWGDEETRRLVLDDPDWPEAIDKAAFLRQLDAIRASGYATSIEEREPGAAAVSAPILDRSGRLLAALAVSGPSGRLTPDVMLSYVPAIREAARRMALMMGK